MVSKLDDLSAKNTEPQLELALTTILLETARFKLTDFGTNHSILPAWLQTEREEAAGGGTVGMCTRIYAASF
jgi:hypothetical protein